MESYCQTSDKIKVLESHKIRTCHSEGAFVATDTCTERKYGESLYFVGRDPSLRRATNARYAQDDMDKDVY